MCVCVCRMELRDHDHVVECVAWAPDSASEAINEAAAMDNKIRYLSHPGIRQDSGAGVLDYSESSLWPGSRSNLNFS